MKYPNNSFRWTEEKLSNVSRSRQTLVIISIMDKDLSPDSSYLYLLTEQEIDRYERDKRRKCPLLPPRIRIYVIENCSTIKMF